MARAGRDGGQDIDWEPPSSYEVTSVRTGWCRVQRPEGQPTDQSTGTKPVTPRVKPTITTLNESSTSPADTAQSFDVTPRRHDDDMAQPQLALLEAPIEWRLDEHTREVGRRGVAKARAALQAAINRQADSTDDHQRHAA